MKNRATRICAIAFVVYLILGALFYVIAGDSLHFTNMLGDSVANKANTGEIHEGDKLMQKFICEYDELDQIQLLVSTNARKNNDTLEIQLLDEDSDPLFDKPVEKNTADLQDNAWMTVEFPPIEDAKDRVFILQIESANGGSKNSVSFYCGNTVDTGRFSIKTQVENTEAVTFVDNGNEILLSD